MLKLSGEAFASDAADETIDGAVVERIAKEIAEVRAELGTEMAVVVGGGNIWRGATGSATGMDRASADYMGMLATVINALALQDALERQGQPTRVQTAIGMSQIAEPYIRLRAIRHLEKGRVVVFAAGTGNPFFTTDTAGALRAVEIEADVLLKGTHGGADGVYDDDPRTNPDAHLLRTGDLRRSHGPATAGHGSDRHHPLQGKRPAHPCVLDHGAREPSSRPPGGADRYADPLMEEKSYVDAVLEDCREKMAKGARARPGRVRQPSGPGGLHRPSWRSSGWSTTARRSRCSSWPGSRSRRPRLMVITPVRQVVAQGHRAGHPELRPRGQSQQRRVVIRLSFPPLTEERRKAMVKVAHGKAEDGRVAIRNLRRAARKDLEALEKDGDISSDELDRAEKDLERVTHEFVADVDRVLHHKEEELLAV